MAKIRALHDQEMAEAGIGPEHRAPLPAVGLDDLLPPLPDAVDTPSQMPATSTDSGPPHRQPALSRRDEQERPANSVPAPPSPTARVRAIMNGLEPVFRAAALFPGFESGIDPVATAINRLSAQAVLVAQHAAALADPLEVDTTWVRQELLAAGAGLVSSCWVAIAMRESSKKGVPISQDMAANDGILLNAVSAALRNGQPYLVVEPPADPALAAAIVEALTPIVLDIEDYMAYLGSHLPNLKTDPLLLTRELGSLIGELVDTHTPALLQTTGQRDSRAPVHALLVQTGGKALNAAWQQCRAELMQRLRGMASEQESMEYLSQPQFLSGYPMQALRARTQLIMQRLIGASVHAFRLLEA